MSTQWSGGIFISPTLAGSRSGGIIAATWAALMNHGVDGYIKASKAIFDTVAYIVDAVKNVQGLNVMGDPKVCIVAFTSDIFNIYSFSDEMKARGWLLSAMQYPTCVHIYIVPMHTQEGIKERFVKDVAEVAQALVKNPPKELEGRVSTIKSLIFPLLKIIVIFQAAMYGMAQKIPDSSLIEEIAENFIDVLYSTKQ